MNNTAYLCRLGGDGNILNGHTLVYEQRQKLGEVHFVQVGALVELLRQSSLCSKNLMPRLSHSWKRGIGGRAYHIVRQPRVIRICGPIDGRERSYNINERVLRGAKGEIDQVESDHRFDGWFRRS